jgi:hypothetical protein
MVSLPIGGPLELLRCGVISKARRSARSARVGHPVSDVAAPAAKVLRISADLGASMRHRNPLGVDLAGLKAELVGQVGKTFFAIDMATDDLSLLRRGKMPARLSHGTHFR